MKFTKRLNPTTTGSPSDEMILLKFQRAKLIAEERKKKNEALGIKCDQAGHPLPPDPDEVRDRSYLEEVTTIFSLRDEK